MSGRICIVPSQTAASCAALRADMWIDPVGKRAAPGLLQTLTGGGQAVWPIRSGCDLADDRCALMNERVSHSLGPSGHVTGRRRSMSHSSVVRKLGFHADR